MQRTESRRDPLANQWTILYLIMSISLPSCSFLHQNRSRHHLFPSPLLTSIWRRAIVMANPFASRHPIKISSCAMMDILKLHMDMHLPSTGLFGVFVFILFHYQTCDMFLTSVRYTTNHLQYTLLWKQPPHLRNPGPPSHFKISLIK